MCPDQESNWRTFAVWDDAQLTEPHQSGRTQVLQVLSHGYRNLPRSQPTLFKPVLQFRGCWGSGRRGEGKPTYARGLKGSCFIMFINRYLAVVPAISGCPLNTLQRQVLVLKWHGRVWLWFLWPERRWHFPFCCMVSRKAHFYQGQCQDI